MDKRFLEQLAKELEDRGMLLLGGGAIDREDPETFARFERWLADGKHAEMKFLENHLAIRKRPRLLLDDTDSTIALIVALPYHHNDNTIPLDGDVTTQVARYSLLRDYHREIPKRVKSALGALHADKEPSAGKKPWNYRVVTDSAPILERATAERHSEGFIGKNTMFIHPRKGSFLLLGEVIAEGEWLVQEPTGKAVEPTTRTADGGCGTCTRCQTHCPTGALDSAYTLDARHCLAYWSIEHRGTVPYRYWRHFDQYLFGCDICQTTCPYNRPVLHKSKSQSDRQLAASFKLRELPTAAQLVTMSQKDYEQWFGGIAMTRAKRTGLRRNGLLALAAAGHRHQLAASLSALASQWAQPTEAPDPILKATAMTAAYWAEA